MESQFLFLQGHILLTGGEFTHDVLVADDLSQDCLLLESSNLRNVTRNTSVVQRCGDPRQWSGSLESSKPFYRSRDSDVFSTRKLNLGRTDLSTTLLTQGIRTQSSRPLADYPFATSRKLARCCRKCNSKE